MSIVELVSIALAPSSAVTVVGVTFFGIPDRCVGSGPNMQSGKVVWVT